MPIIVSHFHALYIKESSKDMQNTVAAIHAVASWSYSVAITASGMLGEL